MFRFTPDVVWVSSGLGKVKLFGGRLNLRFRLG